MSSDDDDDNDDNDNDNDNDAEDEKKLINPRQQRATARPEIASTRSPLAIP